MLTHAEEMILYFRGERAIGITVLMIGVVVVAALLYLWKGYKEPLGYGLMIPLALLVVAGFGLGPTLIVTSNQRIERFTSLLKTDQAAFVKEEIPRMAKVNANWFPLKVTWAILLLLSLIVIFTVKREFWVGVALGFLVLSTTLFVVDSFAQKRGLRYGASLERKA